ncbi:MAG: hypothetical protein GX443_01710 [Deltaproteobacteria bacterium]|nr:hypothetical protein [Deltaproteobacteria bacterium]
MPSLGPFLVFKGAARSAFRLRRVHHKLDERFIQELIVTYPELLPVKTLRPEIGEITWIRRSH